MSPVANLRVNVSHIFDVRKLTSYLLLDPFPHVWSPRPAPILAGGRSRISRSPRPEHRDLFGFELVAFHDVTNFSLQGVADFSVPDLDVLQVGVPIQRLLQVFCRLVVEGVVAEIKGY